MMIRDWVDVAFISVIIIGLCVIVGIMFLANGDWNECEKRGGMVVKTPNGYICAKVERI
jgi:hypothetical protein